MLHLLLRGCVFGRPTSEVRKRNRLMLLQPDAEDFLNTHLQITSR